MTQSPDIPKKTPWFDGGVKPVRRGWYERDYIDGFAVRNWFDGYRWYPKEFAIFECLHQRLPWRGLTAPARVPRINPEGV